MKNNIAVFASGAGSNFRAIFESFQGWGEADAIRLVVTNNPEAGALIFARESGISTQVFQRKQFDTFTQYSESMLQSLRDNDISILVLAGYMVRLPQLIVSQYEDRIVNIHPALLPSFGGKGFYGMRVHEAVIESGVKLSGITIHFVNNEYDKGSVIFQKSVDIDIEDTAESLAEKVLHLEHQWYPIIVKKLFDNKIQRFRGKIRIYD